MNKVLEDSRKIVDCSFLNEDVGCTLRDSSTEYDCERRLLFQKVNELYEKLQLKIEECIQLKEQNQQLKTSLQLRQPCRTESHQSLFDYRDKALLNMFVDKISRLEEENRLLRQNKENSIISSTGHSRSPEMSNIIYSPQITRLDLGKTSSTKCSTIMSPRESPTLHPGTAVKNPISSKLRGSIDNLWNQSPKYQPQPLSSFIKFK